MTLDQILNPDTMLQLHIAQSVLGLIVFAACVGINMWLRADEIKASIKDFKI